MWAIFFFFFSSYWQYIKLAIFTHKYYMMWCLSSSQMLVSMGTSYSKITVLCHLYIFYWDCLSFICCMDVPEAKYLFQNGMKNDFNTTQSLLCIFYIKVEPDRTETKSEIFLCCSWVLQAAFQKWWGQNFFFFLIYHLEGI